MGGTALNIYGIKTERKTTQEHLKIESYLISLISSVLNTEVKGVKFYHNKETHGDCDLLVLNNNLGNIQEILKDHFGIIHCNGGVYSFAYDNYQIDLILQPEEYWDCVEFFDYDPTGNLMGKIAHKFDLKYGFKGLVYVFRSGSVRKDFVISKDSNKIFEFLGFDYQRYAKGFDSLEDIFDYITSSKYFNKENFLMENLNSIDKKRNKKRATYQQFIQHINQYKDTLSSYSFSPDKSTYFERINNFFPEADLKNKIKEAVEDIELKKLISQKFNGNLVMLWTKELTGFSLTGEKLSKCIGQFKTYCEKEHCKEISFEEFILNNSIEDVFKTWFL